MLLNPIQVIHHVLSFAAWKQITLISRGVNWTCLEVVLASYELIFWNTPAVHLSSFLSFSNEVQLSSLI
jgi:hypothetical protein